MSLEKRNDARLPLRRWDQGPGCESQLPFFIRRIEEDSNDAWGGIAAPARQAYYEILYVSEGRGTHFIDFQAYQVQPKSLIFSGPGQVRYAEMVERYRGFVIVFPEDFLSMGLSLGGAAFELAFFQATDRKPVTALSADDAGEISGLFDAIQGEFRAKGPGFLTVLRSYLHILLVRASRGVGPAAEQPALSSSIATSRRFKQLVSEQVRQVRSVNAFARQLGISPGHLHDVVKTATGLTPSDIIQQELMLEAKRLLAHSDYTIAEVGYQLNFEDPAYFGRYFRRNQKMSPGQFRTQMRKAFWLEQAG